VRFQEEINDRLRAEVDGMTQDLADVPMEDLWRRASHRVIDMRATEEFAREFRRQQLFYAVRDPVNHRMRYFERVAELDDLDDELRTYLYEQYEDLMVDPTEGKDLPPQADSSTSSELEDQDSGLTAATA
jgi:hypothetical protein